MAVAFLDPAAAIKRYESGGNYTVGYGGADLSAAPLSTDGFPQWAGKDNSHAAGAYQFEPGTWAIYADRLGITDFSPKSQDAVFAACFAVRRFSDWLPYNTKLAAAVKAAGGTAMYSLGATWLAMSRVPQPVPTPIPEPVPPDVVTVTLVAQGADQSGRPIPIVLKGLGVAAVVAMAMGSILISGPKTIQNVATAPLVQESADVELPGTKVIVFCPPGQVTRCLFPAGR